MTKSLDRVLNATADWVEADRAAKVAGLWLAIGTGVFTVVAVVWMVHQVRMIGGF